MKIIASVLILLASSPCAAIAETSQPDQVITATATGSNEASACSAARGKAQYHRRDLRLHSKRLRHGADLGMRRHRDVQEIAAPCYYAAAAGRRCPTKRLAVRAHDSVRP